jgi:hypothetical protein
MIAASWIYAELRHYPGAGGRCAEALMFHRDYQHRQKNKAGSKWHEHGLVSASAVGTQRNANNVLRSFRAIVKRAGLNEAEWTPREMRHRFASLPSDSGGQRCVARSLSPTRPSGVG